MSLSRRIPAALSPFQNRVIGACLLGGLLGGAQSQALFISFMTEAALNSFLNSRGWTVQLTIAASRFALLKDRRRSLAGRTGCGLCGTESLDQAVRALSLAVLKLAGWKVEGMLPDSARKSVLIAAPHTSNWDLPYTLMVGFALHLNLYWMGKASLFGPPFGALMRWLKKRARS